MAAFFDRQIFGGIRGCLGKGGNWRFFKAEVRNRLKSTLIFHLISWLFLPPSRVNCEFLWGKQSPHPTYFPIFSGFPTLNPKTFLIVASQHFPSSRPLFLTMFPWSLNGFRSSSSFLFSSFLSLPLPGKGKRRRRF